MYTRNEVTVRMIWTCLGKTSAQTHSHSSTWAIDWYDRFNESRTMLNTKKMWLTINNDTTKSTRQQKRPINYSFIDIHFFFCSARAYTSHAHICAYMTLYTWQACNLFHTHTNTHGHTHTWRVLELIFVLHILHYISQWAECGSLSLVFHRCTLVRRVHVNECRSGYSRYPRRSHSVCKMLNPRVNISESIS